MKCEIEYEVPGPHPGCVEFAPPDVFVCGQTVVREVTLMDPTLRHEITFNGGWDAYRDMVVGLEGTDPGPDPGAEHWGEIEWLVCEGHAADIRVEAKADGAGFVILKDEEVG